MNVSDIITLINGVGFPIFACIAMGAFIVWDMKQRSVEKKQRKESEDYTLNTLKKAVDNNTRIIEKLYNAIMKGEKDNGY